MNVNKAAWRGAATREWNPQLRRAVSFLVATLRLTLYAVLAVLRPFIVIALSAVAIGGVILCLFYGLLTRGTHFPTFTVLVVSVVSAVSIVLFYALMDLLLPKS
jgi:hypothetical protein